MKRTWEFNAAAIVGPQVQVTPSRIGVAQKSAYVSFWVKNTSAVPVAVDAGTFTLRLPDGTTIDGHTSFHGRAYDGARSLLTHVGISDKRAKNAVPPGGSVEIALNFRQY